MKQENKGGRPLKYPLGARLQAKALFIACKSYAEIEVATGIPRNYLRLHASHQGWCELRKSPEQRTQALVSVQSALAEWEAGIAAETQSLSLDAMPLVRAAIDKGSARDLKDSAAGVKTLVEIARLSSGMDEKQDRSAGVNTPSIAMFCFMGPARKVGEPKLVTPIVEQIAAPAHVGEAEPEFD